MTTQHATIEQTAQALRTIADLIDRTYPLLPARIEVTWPDWSQEVVCYVSRPGRVPADEAATWVTAWARALHLTAGPHLTHTDQHDRWFTGMSADGMNSGIRFHVGDSSFIDPPAEATADPRGLCPCRNCQARP